MTKSNEINKDLVALLEECITSGSRGYINLGVWFDATCQRIADTLEDIKRTEPEGSITVQDKLKSTIEDLLEALNNPFPDQCDCGGSDMCAICNAHRVLGELNE